MPIRADRMALYPGGSIKSPEWRAIRERIGKRSGWKCETCGAPHMTMIARGTYRPDLYRSALKPLGVALPGANAKVEGALAEATPVGSAGASLTLGPDGFFDGQIFDPDALDAYIAAQSAP